MAGSSSAMKEKNTQTKTPSLQTLQADPLLQVFGNVASNSIEDICNLKQTCKRFRHLGEDDYVYKHSSLEKFACLPGEWNRADGPFAHYVGEVICPEDAMGMKEEFFEWPMSPEERFNMERKLYFFNRCLQCQNPEVIYRQAMIVYFKETSSPDSKALAFENLKKAALDGHDSAKYVCSMLLMCTEDEAQRNHGFVVFRTLVYSDKLKQCRDRVMSFLKSMWVRRNPLCSQNYKICESSICTIPKVAIKHDPWNTDDDYYLLEIQCEKCKADAEVGYFIRKTFV